MVFVVLIREVFLAMTTTLNINVIARNEGQACAKDDEAIPLWKGSPQLRVLGLLRSYPAYPQAPWHEVNQTNQKPANHSMIFIIPLMPVVYYISQS